MVQPYFRNAQKEITKSATPYFIDLGLRNLILGRWGALTEPRELGFVFQNLVYHLLVEKYPNTPVKYWRTINQAEVDFVVEDASHLGVFPVEVKYASLKKPEITKSLRSFIDKYHPQEAWVVNISLDQVVVTGDTVVRFMPLCALLSPIKSIPQEFATA
jgi:predicted AAA+ superfamily ATPase